MAVGVSSFALLNSNLRLSEKFHAPKANGVAPSKTGAPGENNCTQCHSGTVQSGNGVNNISFSGGTTYVPGSTYTMNVDITGASSKNGFQIVALDGNDNQAGSWSVTNASTTTTQSNMGRSYINHTGAGTSLNSWGFDWDAPSSDVGDVTFYLATNVTNSNNSSSGDMIYISQFTIQSETSNGISYLDRLNESFTVTKQDLEYTLNLDLENSANVTVNAFSLDGKHLYSRNHGRLNAGLQNLTANFNYNGLIIWNVFVDNNIVYKKTTF